MAKEVYTAKNGLKTFQNGVRLSSRTLAYNDNPNRMDVERAVGRRSHQLAMRYATNAEGIVYPDKYIYSLANRVGNRMMDRLRAKR